MKEEAFLRRRASLCPPSAPHKAEPRRLARALLLGGGGGENELDPLSPGQWGTRSGGWSGGWLGEGWSGGLSSLWASAGKGRRHLQGVWSGCPPASPGFLPQVGGPRRAAHRAVL